MSKERTSKPCSKCLESKHITRDYYLAAHDLISKDGRLSICKECMRELIDMQKPETLINIMRAVDRPFLRATYEDALNHNNPFGEYMRMLATHQFREKTYLDSDFSEGLSEYQAEHKLEQSNDEDEDMRKKWGNYEDDDIEYLENFYQEYANTYSTTTPAQRMLYKNIAKTHLQAEKELTAGRTKQYKDLMDLSSKLHTDGHIKPTQNTGANDDQGLSTYGLWIREIEKEEPCEYFENKPLYEDYDSIRKYWEKWFVRPFKNIFNLSNDFDVRDDD